MPSFSTSLSGLDATSQDLSVISNNLANLNTTAYKGATTEFQDLFYQQIGSSGDGNPIQVGVGVTVGSVPADFTQGTIQSTGVPTDLAIQGNGFLIGQNNGQLVYIRAGDLSISANGTLVAPDGSEILGDAAVGGVINTNQVPGPLTIAAGLINPPKATANANLAINLDPSATPAANVASQQTGTGIAPATILATGSTLAFTDGTNAFTYTTLAGNTLNTIVDQINANPNFNATISGNSLVINDDSGNPITFTTNTLTDAATGAEAEAFAASANPAPTFSTSLAVYDSLGLTHILTYNFTKTAANNWNYSITIPAADLGGTGNPVVIKTGTLAFNGSGQLIAPAANVTGINITGFADGASPLTFNWNLFSSPGVGLITQVSGPSATSSTNQDGFASGSLVSFSIGSDGTIEGSFSNGQTQPLGRILLASFANEQGLDRNGENEFLATLASGAANVGVAGTGGRGTISGGALEQSNVDISTQFADLILAERGFQANAKVVTTIDTVTQTAISLIQ